MIEYLDYQSPLGKNDHVILKSNFKFYSASTLTPRRKTFYNRADFSKINETIEETPWYELFQEVDDINCKLGYIS